MTRLASIFLLAGLTVSQALYAAEWYEQVSYVRSDPFQFDAQRRVLFPNSGITLAGNPATGKQYAILSAAKVLEIEQKSNHLVVIDTHPLKPSEAASYKKIFRDAASYGKIPWIVGAIGSIPGAATAVIGATVTLMDGVSRLASSKTVSADALEQLMAKGGRFDLVLGLNSDPGDSTHKYVSSAVVYSVSVGNEARSYLICATTFAVKVQ